MHLLAQQAQVKYSSCPLRFKKKRFSIGTHRFLICVSLNFPINPKCCLKHA